MGTDKRNALIMNDPWAEYVSEDMYKAVFRQNRGEPPKIPD